MRNPSSCRIVQCSFLIILFITLYSTIPAQFKYTTYQHIGIDQGLSSRVVNDVLQDENGFLWFATDNGLHKYDGYKFTVYKNDTNDPFSISHNKINKIIYTEIHGRDVMWIATEGGGLNAFDVAWERFINWKEAEKDTSWDAMNNAHCSVFFDTSASEFKMYYSSFHGSDNSWQIGYAFAQKCDSLGELEWIKYEGNPVLKTGKKGEWDSKGVTAPAVIKLGDKYEMWYTGMADDMVLKIGYAESRDGIHWTKFKDNPVLTEDSQPTWKNCGGALFPSVTFNGEKYHMWYGSNDEKWERGKIGHATSKDGRKWNKDKNNPVVNTFSKGHWGDKIVGAPTVFNKNGLYYMVYAAKTFMPYKKSNLALAVSEDGSHWISYDEPIVEINPGFETQYWSQWVIPFNNMYHMWYTEGGVDYASYSTSNFLNIRYAYSIDLKKWKRKRDNRIWEKEYKGLSSNFVRTVHYDKAGFIWIGLSGNEAGLNRIKIPQQDVWFDQFSTKGNVYQKEIRRYLNSNFVNDITQDNLGNIWSSADKFGVFCYNSYKDNFVNYRIKSDTPNYLTSFSINKIYCDNENIIWGALENGTLIKINQEESSGEKIKQFALPQNEEISNLFGDDHNLIISKKEGGIRIFDRINKKFLSDDLYPEYLLNLEDCKVNSFFKDKNGIVWICTDQGILKIASSPKKISNYQPTSSNTQSTEATNITAILESKTDKNSIWIGTEVLIKYDTKSGISSECKIIKSPNNQINENRITSLCEDKNGDIWIGTRSTLRRYDPAKELFKTYRKIAHNLLSISGNGINSILEDSYGELWIGSGDGLQRFNRSTEEFPYVMADRVNTIHETVLDGEKVLLLGMFENGFRKLNLQNHKYTAYTHDQNDEQSLSNNNVNIFAETMNDGRRILWIGTNGGLNKLVLNNEKSETQNDFRFTHYTEEDGLSGDIVKGILEDDNGNLWISTNHGISKFDPVKEKFKSYRKADGLLSNEFSINSCLKSSSGKLYFGGLNGLTSFFPDSLHDNLNIPNIVITDLLVFNKPVEINSESSSSEIFSIPKHISMLDTLLLSYKDNVFSIQFTALDFQNPQKNKYKYILEGFEKKWTYTNSDMRQVTYTNLDPGKYNFRVCGTNSDGYWNEAGRSLFIIISAPWWATTWAYLGYIISALVIIFLIWKFQLSKIQLKHTAELEHIEAEKYREMDHLKSRFFANISHEFRTPLTLILGPIEKLITKTDGHGITKDLRMIKRNAKHLYYLINQLLDLSKLEANKMTLRASQYNIVEFVKGLVMSFVSLAEKKNILLKLNCQQEKIPLYFDKDLFAKILNNLISNAFKFTESNGCIDITLSKVEQPKSNNSKDLSEFSHVEITVSDTGIGIPPDRLQMIFDRFYQVDGNQTREREGTGIGLSITKELVEMHKGEISVVSEENKGTTFTLKFPIGSKHLKREEIIEKPGEGEEDDFYLDETEVLLSLDETIPIDQLNISLNYNKPLVLVVEDNRDVREFIKNYLKEDYTILESNNGSDGLEKAIENIPDLVLSDIMMPKMNGVELCNRIKTDERTSHIPVILLTAKASGEDKIEGLKIGADDYIMKPFNAEELLVRIKNLIEQRIKLREHYQKQGIFEIKDGSHTSVDRKFLQKACRIIDEKLANPNLNVEILAEQLAMSRTQIFRKFSALFNESPNAFIRRIRLSKAAKLLELRNGNISEIAFEVGFNSPSYFAKCFKRQFMKTPSEFEKSL